MKYTLILVLAILASRTTVQSASVKNGTQNIRSSPYLLGGSKLSPLGHQFVVLLRFQTEFGFHVYCNGVRLNERWILTAAECLDSPKFTDVRITVVEKGKYVHKDYNFHALRFRFHPKYDSKTKQDNIALLKCDFPDWTDRRQRLQLPSRKDDSEKFFRATLRVVGFEHQTNPLTNVEEYFVSHFLVEVATFDVCLGMYDRSAFVNHQTCTTPYNTLQAGGLNEGDLGVPVVLNGRYLFGIALKVTPWYGSMDQPIVFHRIYPYVDWISKITGIRPSMEVM